MTTILIIDDEIDVRETVQDILVDEGFHVLEAANGEEGIHLAQDCLPDLVLCDVQMRNLDGYAVLAALQENPTTATLPFIFLTGKDTLPDFRQGMGQGADDYLTKPVRIDVLLQAINRRLEKREAHHAATQKLLDEVRHTITGYLPHELRTPLTGLTTSIQLLRLVADDSAQVLEIADNMQISIERLSQLIQRFLLYVRLERVALEPSTMAFEMGNETFAPEIVIQNVAQLVANRFQRVTDLRMQVGSPDLTRQSSSLSSESDLELALNPMKDLNPYPDSSVAIAFPSHELEQMLREIIDNAFKFSKPGTPIYIQTPVENQRYWIYVTNEGRGMTAEQISNIGGYIQFDRSLYEQQGVGLGLAIVKRLAEIYDATFELESVPNEKTTLKLGFQLI